MLKTGCKMYNNSNKPNIKGINVGTVYQNVQLLNRVYITSKSTKSQNVSKDTFYNRGYIKSKRTALFSLSKLSVIKVFVSKTSKRRSLSKIRDNWNNIGKNRSLTKLIIKLLFTDCWLFSAEKKTKLVWPCSNRNSSRMPTCYLRCNNINRAFKYLCNIAILELKARVSGQWYHSW